MEGVEMTVIVYCMGLVVVSGLRRQTQLSKRLCFQAFEGIPVFYNCRLH